MGYGYFIEIQYAGGFHSFYGHLSRILVNVEERVNTQQIACLSSTRVTTGSHLHYEVRKGKRDLNPSEWCGSLFEILRNKFLNKKIA